MDIVSEKSNMLLKPTIQVTGLTIVSIVLNFVTQVAVAYFFGASLERDAYFTALVFPTYISAVITGSIGFIFLPIYVNIKNDEGVQEAESFFRTAISFSALGCLTIVLAGMILSDKLVAFIAPGFVGNQFQLTSRLLTILMPTIIFQVLTNIAASIMQIRNRFVLPALTPIATALVTLVTVLFFSKMTGIESLAYGSLAGTCISFLMIACFLGKSLLSSFTFKQVNLRHLSRLIRTSAPLLLTGIFFRLTGVFERGIASKLSPGSISYLGYANQIMMILATITSSGLAVTIYPLLSKAWTEKNTECLYYYFKKSIRTIFLITLPISIIFIFWGDILVTLVFERGEFNHQTSIAVYRIFCIMVFAFISNCLGNIIVKIFYLSGKTFIASLSELLGLIFYIVPAFLLSKWYGYIGMAVATSIGASLSILLSFGLSLRILKKFNTAALARDLLKIVISVTIAGIVSFMFNSALSILNISNFASLVLGCTVFLPTYFLALKYFRIQEIDNLNILYRTAYEKIIG
jgi:putative peptidoglycan lipid II flippase